MANGTVGRPATSAFYKKLMESDDFKTADKTAKEVVRYQLLQLDMAGFLKPTDYVTCLNLINNYSVYYKMKKELDKTAICYADKRNGSGVVVNSLVGAMNRTMSTIESILNKMGSNATSRRRLNQKEMADAESAPIDNIINTGQMDMEGFDEEGF